MNRLLLKAPYICQTCVRGLGTSQLRLVKADLTKIKRKQEHFQMENDVPVYLKGGPFDSFIFYTTAMLIVTGLGLSVQAVYQLRNRK